MLQWCLAIEVKLHGLGNEDVATTKVSPKSSFPGVPFAYMMTHVVRGNISNILQAQGKLPEATAHTAHTKRLGVTRQHTGAVAGHQMPDRCW